jgi:ATP-dependent DNA helicase RecG
MIARGEAQLVIGTHALIEESVDFAKLGLVVVDEQHRFGVLQRFRLMKKPNAGEPDVLVMTATPIPRTLALSLYGDLDLSVLDELPPGRTPILTRQVSDDMAGEIWAWCGNRCGWGTRRTWSIPSSKARKRISPNWISRPASRSRGRNRRPAKGQRAKPPASCSNLFRPRRPLA